MNLGKLLAAGKSIIGGRREISIASATAPICQNSFPRKIRLRLAVKVEPAPKAEAVPVKREPVSDGTKTQKLPAFPAARLRKRTWVGKFNPHFILAQVTDTGTPKKRGIPCRPSFPWTG